MSANCSFIAKQLKTRTRKKPKNMNLDIYTKQGPLALNQGLSMHQEVSSNPVTKVTKFVVFLGTFLVQ